MFKDYNYYVIYLNLFYIVGILYIVTYNCALDSSRC